LSGYGLNVFLLNNSANVAQRDRADIASILENSTPATSMIKTVATISPKKITSPSPAPAVTPAQGSDASPNSPTASLPSAPAAATPFYEPLSTLTATYSPTPEIQPEVQTVSPTPTPVILTSTSHIFYTSSYKTSKYYYCDTDTVWKTLKPENLKSFSSESELLSNFPTRTLHKPCK